MSQNFSYGWVMGPGYWIYWLFCFSGGIIRATIHWLTPLPGMGVGAFNFQLPKQGFGKAAKAGSAAIAATAMVAHGAVDGAIKVGKGAANKVVHGVELGHMAAQSVGHKIADGADKINPKLGDGMRFVGHNIDDATVATVKVVTKGVEETGRILVKGAHGTGKIVVKGAQETGAIVAKGVDTATSSLRDGYQKAKSFTNKVVPLGSSMQNLPPLNPDDFSRSSALQPLPPIKTSDGNKEGGGGEEP